MELKMCFVVDADGKIEHLAAELVEPLSDTDEYGPVTHYLVKTTGDNDEVVYSVFPKERVYFLGGKR